VLQVRDRHFKVRDAFFRIVHSVIVNALVRQSHYLGIDYFNANPAETMAD
jgi:hypothetical protein